MLRVTCKREGHGRVVYYRVVPVLRWKSAEGFHGKQAYRYSLREGIVSIARALSALVYDWWDSVWVPGGGERSNEKGGDREKWEGGRERERETRRRIKSSWAEDKEGGRRRRRKHRGRNERQNETKTKENSDEEKQREWIRDGDRDRRSWAVNARNKGERRRQRGSETSWEGSAKAERHGKARTVPSDVWRESEHGGTARRRALDALLVRLRTWPIRANERHLRRLTSLALHRLSLSCPL